MTVYAAPGSPDCKVVFKPRYEHWIGGGWVAPAKGQYFEDISPVNGKPFAEVARGTAEDIEVALDALLALVDSIVELDQHGRSLGAWRQRMCDGPRATGVG